MPSVDNPEFLRELQNRQQRKLLEKELEAVLYWKQQLDRLLLLKPEGVASLQAQIKKLSEMMANRAATLKRNMNEGTR